MNPKTFYLKQEILKRKKESHTKVNWSKFCFPAQLEFVLDDHNKFIAATTTRQAGKTTGDAYKLVRCADNNADVDCLYITLTRTNAKKRIWKDLKKAVKNIGLVGVVFNNTELSVLFPNQSQIYLLGAKDESAVEDIRGGRNKLVIFDESDFSRVDMNHLIDEVIAPTLIAHDGQFVMTSTPAATKSFMYYIRNSDTEKLYDDDGNHIKLDYYKKYHWSVLDNVGIPNAKEYIEKLKKKKGYTDESPAYKREWLGLDCIDDSILMYKYNPSLNIYEKVPVWSPEEVNHVIAVDLGFDDSFVISVLAYSDYSKEVYVLETYKKAGETPDFWLQKIKEYKEKYNNAQVICDTGNLGKSIVIWFNKQGVVVEPAEKSDKLAYIEIVNGALQRGELKVRSDNPVIKEWLTLQKDDRGKEDSRQANDCCDTILYGYRLCRVFIDRQRPTPKHEYMSEGYINQEVEKMKQDRLRQIKKENKKNWWQK
jgi:phage terminase large subunit